MSNNKQILTAKELFDKMIEVNDECTSTEMMIEFAKLHVAQALLKASENAQTECDEGGETGFVNKETVLNAYPLNNIK